MLRTRFLIVLLLTLPAFAQTRPAREIRRGMMIPATEPSRRMEAILEQIARRAEPDLNGRFPRLATYVDFYKRESVRDPRLFPCDVSANIVDGDTIELTGFVEFPAHQQSLELLLRSLRFGKIRNHIEIVTDKGHQPGFGIVDVPRCAVFDRIEEPHEHLTEALFGEPVFILRLIGRDYAWVHTSDGYVGYIGPGNFRQVDQTTFTEYQLKARTVLHRASDSSRGPLPAGARLQVVSKTDATLECQLLDEKKFSVPRSSVIEADTTATMQKIEGAVLAAQKLIGTPYVWGGRTADGIDCSGLTQMAYASQGVNLPRDADQQAYVGRMVATSWYRDAMQRGDLMFFLGRRGAISHVALYLGDNQFIEAADGGVKISSMKAEDPKYEPKREKSFAFARRVIE